MNILYFFVRNESEPTRKPGSANGSHIVDFGIGI
jgi:hypothetical protein